MTPTGSPCPPAPRWALLPHPPGRPAEPVARAWLASQWPGPPPAPPIERDARGRPRFGGAARLDCNWSHSGEHLLVALGDGVRVGADLERLRPRPRALDIARRFFDPAEADWLAALAPAARGAAFARLWCAKEAVLKAHGHGLVFGLHRLRFAVRGGAFELVAADPALGAPGEWRLLGFEPAPGYVAAIAWRTLAAYRAAEPAY